MAIASNPTLVAIQARIVKTVTCYNSLKASYNVQYGSIGTVKTMSEVDSSDIKDAKKVENKNSGTSKFQTLSRWVLGVALLLAGIGHLTWARTEFLAQVPPWVPLEGDLVVVLSGIVEIFLGGALIAQPKYRAALGWITAVFFVLILPGNISQYDNQIDAFGLDSDLERGIRLLFQPLLVIWALWSTGAWRAWRESKNR